MQHQTFHEAVLPGLLALFYERVRRDPVLGGIFNDVVADWPEHLRRLEDFWSSVMLTSGRYKGNPVALHLIHAERIDPAMFEIWLALWQTTTEEMLPLPVACEMQAKAARIAGRLAQAITAQVHCRPAGASPDPVATSVEPYRLSPEFDEGTVPAALLRAHSTRAGVWGVVRLSHGRLLYHVDDGSAPAALLTPEVAGFIMPQQHHHLEVIGPFRMRIEFYDRDPSTHPADLTGE